MENDPMNRHQSEVFETSENPLTTTTNIRGVIAKIILKSRLACSLPALDFNEMRVAVEAWNEVLSGAIPIGRFSDCYVYAMRNRESSFALNAMDMIAAWKSIRSSEMHKTPPGRFELSGDVCSKCWGTGVEVVEDEFHKTTSARPCSH